MTDASTPDREGVRSPSRLSGFTPGPWFVGWENTICHGSGRFNEIPLSTGWIEGCWQGDDATEESIANARLIAAAPELYEALDRIWNGDGLTAEAKLAAQLALAKARGESA